MNEQGKCWVRHVEGGFHLLERKAFFSCSTIVWKDKNLRKMLHVIHLQKVKENYLTLTISHFTYQYKVICELCNYCTRDKDLKHTGEQLKWISQLSSNPSRISEESDRNMDQFGTSTLEKKNLICRISLIISVYLYMEIPFMLEQNSPFLRFSRRIQKGLKDIFISKDFAEEC